MSPETATAYGLILGIPFLGHKKDKKTERIHQVFVPKVAGNGWDNDGDINISTNDDNNDNYNND